MKQVTTMSRLTNQLEKMFRMINADFFDNQLDTPIITVIPSARSYAHYTPWDAWQCGEDTRRREINIASGTLNRPLEAICASLVHECCHMYNDTVLNLADTSRAGTYHNRQFKAAAEAHGLICSRTDKYGWSHTEPADELLDWILTHDELREIELCRTEPGLCATGTGAHAADGGLTVLGTAKSNSRRYVCPKCNAIVRATKDVNIICADCMLLMVRG